MEPTKKTTILLSPTLHRRPAKLASQRRTSIGELVRTACERQYGMADDENRVAVARALAEFRLPAAEVATMKRESVPDLDQPLP